MKTLNSQIVKDVFAAHFKWKFGGKPTAYKKIIKNLRLKDIDKAIEQAEREGLKIKLNTWKNLGEAESHVLNVLIDIYNYPDPYVDEYKSFLIHRS
jgi:hypothetical protein